MKKWINSYFNFTKSEFNGLLALFIIILLATALPRIYEWVFPEQPLAEELAEIQQMELQGKLEPLSKAPYNVNEGHKDFKSGIAKKPVDLSIFDPNKLDQEGWERRGLSPRQASAIIRYISKGGRFRKAEDLKKMYTISLEVYENLKPYVRMDKAEAQGGMPFDAKRDYALKEHTKSNYAIKERKVYEINSLDTNGLQAIYGIGPAFARRIFKYRERLGGFHQVEQLLEVYGIDSLKFLDLKPQIKIDLGLVRQININEVTYDDLKLHPYLTFKQANAIIAYRKQHGNYSSFAALKKVAILPSETVDKLAPYLSFYDDRNKN